MSAAMRLLAFLALASPVSFSSAARTELAGQATVIDGDTIEIHGQRIRLFGIDAPESSQLCEAAGQQYRCGQHAAFALADRIVGKVVTCQQRDIDRYGRIVAICRVAGDDLSHWLVATGWALAYRQYSPDYIDAEAAAQAAGVGIWRGTFVPPWDWRQGKRLPTETANDNAPGQCVIKGNISSSGERIYHVPGGQYYDRTKIDPSKGERWFCTEAEAQAAGWRKSKR